MNLLEDSEGIGVLILLLVAGVVVIGLVLGGLGLIYFLVRLPQRQRERARMFLNILEVGLRSGQNARTAIVALAAHGERILGEKFNLLVQCMEAGMPLGHALKCIPGFLPDKIVALLGVGDEMGDVGKVLPAARHMMKEDPLHMSVTTSCVTAMATLCWMSGVFAFLKVKIMPQFLMIMRDMIGMGNELPFPSNVWFAWHEWFLIAIWIAFFAVSLVCLYPIASRFMPEPLKFWNDALLYRLPWFRKRLQRNFSVMLAILLDAGVTEEKAVSLAGKSTGNEMLMSRTQRVLAGLRSGMTLAVAMQRLDDTGEFRWRLSNAFHGGGGFMQALAGWHESLDAKAFQQEQTAVHLLRTLMVLFNGLLIGLFATGMFQLLIEIIKGGTLW